jgi:hypothetical protein
LNFYNQAMNKSRRKGVLLDNILPGQEDAELGLALPGQSQAEEILADWVVRGVVGIENFSIISDVTQTGEVVFDGHSLLKPIDSLDETEWQVLLSQPRDYIGPEGQHHRQPVRSRR